jgi:hypothetical protein
MWKWHTVSLGTAFITHTENMQPYLSNSKTAAEGMADTQTAPPASTLPREEESLHKRGEKRMVMFLLSHEHWDLPNSLAALLYVTPNNFSFANLDLNPFDELYERMCLHPYLNV